MTAKEKAIELYNNFYNTSSHPHHVESRQQIAKQCALIAVDEIIEQYEFDVVSDVENKRFIAKLNYWDEVKKEIEKL
jgi:hypothetical protein